MSPGLLFLLICSYLSSSYSVPIKVTGTIKPVKVYGSDDQFHLVYELKVKQKEDQQEHQYFLKKIEVLNKKTQEILAQYEGEVLKPLVYVIKPDGGIVPTTELHAEDQMMVFPYLSFAQENDVSKQLIHRFHFIDNKDPEKNIQFEKGIVQLNKDVADEISSPLQGGGWLALNGPGVLGSHRFAYLNVHGVYHIGQRFAIDWVLIDEMGNVITPGSDLKKNENFLGYGASIYSATDGKVSVVRNEFQDNEPDQIPAEVQNVDNACGNEITIAMDNGHYAHYCHLKPDSMKVQIGDRVNQGQELAALGNSGNSTGPHLHFHISDNLSVLGSEGLPYNKQFWFTNNSRTS